MAEKMMPALPHMRKYGEGRGVERVVGRTEEGNIATGPGTPCQKWIDPSGNVVLLPVRTTRNQKEVIAGQAYEAYIISKKLRQGWLRYEGMPEAERETVIAKRKAAYMAQSEPVRKAWASQDEVKALSNKQAMASAIKEFVDAVKSEAAGELKPTPPRDPKRNG